MNITTATSLRQHPHQMQTSGTNKNYPAVWFCWYFICWLVILWTVLRVFLHPLEPINSRDAVPTRHPKTTLAIFLHNFWPLEKYKETLLFDKKWEIEPQTSKSLNWCTRELNQPDHVNLQGRITTIYTFITPPSFLLGEALIAFTLSVLVSYILCPSLAAPLATTLSPIFFAGRQPSSWNFAQLQLQNSTSTLFTLSVPESYLLHLSLAAPLATTLSPILYAGRQPSSWDFAQLQLQPSTST